MYQAGLFKGKTVLVTGGGSGIGYAIAEGFLRYGAHVFIASRKEERLKKAADQLSASGQCDYFTLDIRDSEAVEQAGEHVKAKADRLDILVNNAGGQFPSPAEDISRNGWNAVVNNNLNGTWWVTQTLAKRFFIPQKAGIIVNIIANIFRGFPGMAHTGAARAGVDNLTKSLAVEWAPYKIRINAIAPGIIRSTGLDQYPPDLLKDIGKSIPMKRLGETGEVADLCLFLSSPLAAYITGETIYLDGGMRLWGDMWEVPAH